MRSSSAALVFMGMLLTPALWPVARDEFKISGYVGKSSTEAAPGITVKLLDGETGKVLDIVRTGFTGRYKFEKLKPGHYIVQANEVQREVMLKAKDLRLDIDLSAKDGSMSYVKAEDIQKAVSSAASAASGAAQPAGPNDPELMASFAGHYWGYSGSTESNLSLCAGGEFAEQSESSYSGSSRDSLGSQTMAWGTAGQSGSRGKWSIQGNLQQGTIHLSYPSGKQTSVSYSKVDSSCYRFGGRTMCRKGPARCQ
jgi:hypothetical protein